MVTTEQSPKTVNGESFDLARLSKAKQAVDVCPNTIRAYHDDGLPLYRRGKVVFFSKSELATFIRNPKAFATG